MVTPHDHRPAGSGAHRRSCSDAAFGAAPVISASAARTRRGARCPGPASGGTTASRHRACPTPRARRESGPWCGTKSYTLARETPDEAAADAGLLDYGFHLFTEKPTGEDSVI
jgi:hypothetical protein